MLKLKTIIEGGSPQGEQLKLLALQRLVNGIGSLERAKKNFESYLDLLQKRDDNLNDIEDFVEVSDISKEDTIEVIRTLNELILMMRSSNSTEDEVFDDKELQKKTIYVKK